jgi:hypothetical protein
MSSRRRWVGAGGTGGMLRVEAVAGIRVLWQVRLSGSGSEAGKLAFSVVSLLSHGSSGPVGQIVPDFTPPCRPTFKRRRT